MSNNVSNLYNIMENQEIQSSSNASSASQSFRSNSLSKSNETDSSQSSPNFMQNLSDDQKRQAKNFTKRIKNQTNCKQFNKTTKKTKKCVVKKAIKKNAKLHMKNTKSDILEVSGSTSASNATPKVAQRVCQYLPLETEELQFLREEDLFNSTQNQINSFFLDGTLKKYKTDEEKFTPKEFLTSHQITPHMRAKMVDWIIEVLANFHCHDETFFLAINLMDRHLEKFRNSLNPNNLHLIGITCMFIASKYEEMYPIKLEVFCEKAAYGKFTKEQIKDKEMEILESLDFDVMGPNVFSFSQIVANKLEVKEQMDDHNLLIFNDLLSYMNKMVSYEYAIIKNVKSSLLSAAVCLVCFKLFEQIDKNFNIALNIQKAKILLDLNENEIIAKANQILLLAKNFDKIYQSSNNLKKYNQDLFDELQKSQTNKSNN